MNSFEKTAPMGMQLYKQPLDVAYSQHQLMLDEKITAFYYLF